ncbi:MAG: phosphotransferase family protein [Arenibacterium sp.]
MSEMQIRCRDLVAAIGLGAPSAVRNVVSLTGGVASDIARFDLGAQTYCAKFALEKLKVAEDWHAPVHRNAAEYAWLRFAADVSPQSAVRLHGRSDALHGFVMDYVAGSDVYLWKSALLSEAPDRGEARQVADVLGRLQAASAASDFDTGPFQNRDDFRALRIDPYLSFTATRRPEAAPALQALGDMLHAAQSVLVHGDVSPKNILMRRAGPVFLDAECACMGDASFDPAFCLNHLVLKAVHLPGSRNRLLHNVADFWQAYLPHLTFTDPDALETRIARLLPALMLARVDGKSPVEYLSQDSRASVRKLALSLLTDPETRLKGVTDRIRVALG